MAEQEDRAWYQQFGRWPTYLGNETHISVVAVDADGRESFEAIDVRLSAMHGYAPMDHEAACREAFRRVRRDVWSERESRLVAKWEGYG